MGMSYEAYQESKLQGGSVLHPMGLTSFLVTSFFLLKLPRNKALVPFILLVFLVPMNQRVVLANLDFFLVRLLIMVGILRLSLRSEFYAIGKNKIDRIFYLFIFSMCVAYIALWQTTGAAVNRLGYVIDTLGLYILFRSLIRDFEDVERIVKILSLISIVIAVFMIIEQITGRNVFSIFGGAPEFTAVRDGRLRSQACFGHPIYAGIFGATLFPAFTWLWLSRTGTRKRLAMMSMISSGVIVVTASSSGPLLAFIASILAMFMYRYKSYTRALRWSILLILLALHFVIMKGPVWALLQRATVVGGSTSYHRYVLVDQFINRFDEWWLRGTQSTAHWSPFLEVQTWDVANHYVRIGVDGGFITFSLFILLLATSFTLIGKGMKKYEAGTHKQLLLWSMGSMLFSHMLAFMGASYYGQISVLLILTYALISVVTDSANRESEAQMVQHVPAV